jgi:hypothetical protein
MFTRILKLTILVGAVTGTVLFALPGVASAATPSLTGSFALTTGGDVKCGANEVHPKEYNGDVDVRSCCPKSAGANPTSMQCFFAKYINPVVNLLSIGFGIVVVGSVIAGGIQISTSAGDSGKFAKGRERIVNSLLALAGFVFLYAFIQWLIPGGVF